MNGATVDQLLLCAWNVSYESWQHIPEYVAAYTLLATIVNMATYVWPLKVGLCLLSSVVSVVNVLVLTRKAMRRSTLNQLLVALETSNMVLSVAHLVLSVLRLSSGGYAASREKLVLETACLFVAAHTSYFTNWMTVVISAWRYLAIRSPLKAPARLTKKRVIRITASFSLICLLGSYALFANKRETANQLEICSDLSAQNFTAFVYHHLEDSEWASQHPRENYVIGQVMKGLFFLVPSVGLVSTTVLLLTTIFSFRKRRSNLREGQTGVYIEKGSIRTTVVLCVLLIFYMMSNAVEVVFEVMLMSDRYKSDFKLLTVTYVLSGNFVMMITNSLSFFAYYFMGTNFRSTFLGLFKRSTVPVNNLQLQPQGSNVTRRTLSLK